jgi:hypothetical protein
MRFWRQKTEMKLQLETATAAPPELDSRDGAESGPELPSPPDLVNEPELQHANDAGLQAPIQAEATLAKWELTGIKARGLAQLRLLWAKRLIALYWALAGCCLVIVVAVVIAKQYVSTAKLMPPEAKSARNLAVQELTGGFDSMAGDLLGVCSTGALVVAIMRSRTVEDRVIDRVNLKKVTALDCDRDAAGSKNKLQPGTKNGNCSVERHG